jgi:ligand-binding sensor domain-containing protein
MYKGRGFLFLCIGFLLCVTALGQGNWTIYNTGNSALPDNVIRAIEFDTAGLAWVATDNGLATFNGTTFTVLDSSNSNLPVNQLRSLAFDSAQQLWVGTLQAGFCIYNGNSFTNYNTGNSPLPDDQVRAISFDAYKKPWLGTAGGVVYLSDEGWIVYNMFNTPMGANNINRILIDAADTKWIGTVNGGISKKEGNTWTTYNNHNSGLTDNTVLDFDTDIFGNLWFATPAQGLGRFNGSNWFYRFDANSAIPTNTLTCLEIVKPTDTKYIGTMTNGLLRWNNGLQFDSFTVSNSPLPDNRINCLKRAPDGKFWIGTASGGLAVFEDTTHFQIINSVSKIADGINMKLYPNPVTNVLRIDASQQIQSIDIGTTDGRLLKTELTNGQKLIALNLSELPAGFYIACIKPTAGPSLSSKFVKLP